MKLQKSIVEKNFSCLIEHDSVGDEGKVDLQTSGDNPNVVYGFLVKEFFENMWAFTIKLIGTLEEDNVLNLCIIMTKEICLLLENLESIVIYHNESSNKISDFPPVLPLLLYNQHGSKFSQLVLN